VTLGFGYFCYLNGKVSAAKAVDEERRVIEAELSDDIFLYQRRGGCCKCDNGCRSKRFDALTECAVVGTEVMAPLRDAMRFVDGYEGERTLGEHLGKARDTKPLRSDEEKVELVIEILATDGAGVFAGKT